MTIEHDWVVNFEDCEGVFVCTNPLTINWEPVQIIRAFGTYQFLHDPDPATLAFRHATGVMISYDGAVVAITYADEGMPLTEALSDLFCVLNGLGWRQVDAFHPMATMEAFMADVGHAIPAALHDFDVRPATMGSPIGVVPEGAQLIRHAQEMFGNPKVNAGDVLHDTFVSLMLDEPPFDDEVSVAPGFLSKGGEVVEPEFDTSHLFHDGEPQSQEGSSAHPSMLAEDQVEFPSHTFDNVYSEEPVPEQVHVFEQLQPDSPESLSVIQPVKEEPIPAPQDHKPTALPQVQAMEKAEDTPQNRLRNAGAIKMVRLGGQATPAMIKVGRSVLFFDRPGERMDEAVIGTSMGEIGLQDATVTHLYPGAINGAMRWDVLGEIGDNPWFAEVLAGMMVPRACCALAAALMLAMRKRNATCGLRDLVSVANYPDSDIAELFAAAAGGQDLYQYACGRGRGQVSAVMDALVAQVGCLALVPVGSAFVDMVNIEDAREAGMAIPETITMRGIAFSGEARAYVVHVSELDSPFVVWMAEVLGRIAVIYSSVKPVVKAVVVEAEVDDVAVDPGLAAVNAQVSKILGPVFAQLKAAGIDVASMV